MQDVCGQDEPAMMVVRGEHDHDTRAFPTGSHCCALPPAPSSTMSAPHPLAKLTSTATQTLAHLLERERAQTLSGARAPPHTAQIARNLRALRAGVLALDAPGDARALLAAQYERMRLMLGPDGADLEPCVAPAHMPSRNSYPTLQTGAAGAVTSPRVPGLGRLAVP
jgi:hypothetical protein